MKRLMFYAIVVVGLIVLGKLLERRGHASHGRLMGMIPYDLRVPTPARIKASLWAPDDPNIVVDRVFGIGWSVNFAAVARKLGLG